MANDRAYVSWPGIESIESFSGTLSHGPGPSVFMITCYPQKKPPAKAGTLQFGEGRHKVILKDCIIDSASYRFDASGDLISVNILDRRWRWSGGVIRGEWNRRSDGRGNIAAGQIVGNKKNERELMQLCLDRLGERNVDLSAVGTKNYPEVKWDYDNPGQALQYLCDQFGYRIVLTTKDRIAICRANEGENLPGNYPYEGYGESLDTPELPDSVMVVGAPAIIQCDVELEAVGKETWGEWVPVNSLSYTPANGWSDEPEDDIAADGDDTTDAGLEARQQQGLARQYVYRAYRAKRFFTAKNDYLVKQNVSFDSTETDLFLPYVDRHLDINKKAHNDSYCWGKHKPRDGIAVDITGNNVNVSLKPLLSGTKTHGQRVNVDFRVYDDGGELIVLFREPVFAVDSDKVPLPATIYLRGYFTAHDKDTGGVVRHTDYDILYQPSDGVAKPLIVGLPELEKVFYINGKTSPADISERTKYHLRAEIDKLKSRRPQQANYIGWHPIELDGAIQVISWEFGANGWSMSVSRNQDFGSATTISYAERQMYSRINSLLQQEKNIKALAVREARVNK